jgi:hypothetical protein
MKYLIVTVVILSGLLIGCNQSTRVLTKEYALVRFDEGGTSYYVVKTSDGLTSAGGVFEGTVEKIGSNTNWILCYVKKCYHGDTNGWYALNLKTRQIIGPIEESDLRKNSSFPGITCRTPSDVFAGKN